MPRKPITPQTRAQMLLEIPAVQSEVRKLERRLSNMEGTAEEVDEALFDLQLRVDGLKRQAGYKANK